MQHTVDEIWLVVVEPKLQLERLKERDGLSQQAAKARIAAQLPLASKLPWATEVIDNNGDLDHTKLQVQQCWARALLRASKFADQKE
jgi:dephospho-CoA kinase